MCLLRKYISPDGSNLVVTFYWTKTIQIRERVLHLPLLRTGSVMCPVATYAKMISMIVVPNDATLSPSVVI